jgi:hypothetical protein
MKVEELIRQLKEFPQDIDVKIEYPEEDERETRIRQSDIQTIGTINHKIFSDVSVKWLVLSTEY